MLLFLFQILPSFSSRILFLPVGLSILCQGIICIFANDSDTLSQVLIRTIRGRFPHNHTHMSANDATDYKSEPSNVTRDSLSISLHAKFIDVKSTYSDNNELNSHLKNTSERSDDIMDSVSGDFIQSATTSINDSFDYHGSDASDFVTDMEKNFKETRQTTKVFRRGRSSYVTSQCPSQNVRSLCPWKTVLVSDNTRVPQDIQIRTCVSSIPPRDIGLNDIECENITITKDFRLLNCAASNCIERVVVQVGCIPVFSCHIYSPP